MNWHKTCTKYVGIEFILVGNFGNLDREYLVFASPQNFWRLGQNNFGHLQSVKETNIFMAVNILMKCYAMLHCWKAFSNLKEDYHFSGVKKCFNGTGTYYLDEKCLLRKLKLLSARRALLWFWCWTFLFLSAKSPLYFKRFWAFFCDTLHIFCPTHLSELFVDFTVLSVDFTELFGLFELISFPSSTSTFLEFYGFKWVYMSSK